MYKTITELTEEQKAKFPYYVKKWIDIGTNTDRLEYDKTLEIVNDFQEHILKKDRTPIVIVKNPIEAWVASYFLLNELCKPNDVIQKMNEYFEGTFKCDVPRPSLPYQTGSLFVSIFSFYDYFYTEFPKVFNDQKLRNLLKIWSRTSEIGMIYPLDNVCVVCEKPTVIKLNENNILHCDGGPALEYDGYGDLKIYALEGVNVPEWLATTRANDINIEQYNDIQNADIKAAFIRKVGVERLLGKGVKIDTYENYDEEWWNKSQYELWDMNSIFTSKKYAPYLKMVNQTTGVFHVEGVSPNCKTLVDAIRERFGGMDFTIESIS